MLYKIKDQKARELLEEFIVVAKNNDNPYVADWVEEEILEWYHDRDDLWNGLNEFLADFSVSMAAKVIRNIPVNSLTEEGISREFWSEDYGKWEKDRPAMSVQFSIFLDNLVEEERITRDQLFNCDFHYPRSK
jgi:hypothetical protein